MLLLLQSSMLQRRFMVFAVFLYLLSHVSSLKLTDQYDHTVILDPLEKYQLHWTVNRTDKKISFAVQVNTTGWVGLGFSQGLSGQMKGADIVIGWVGKGGKGHLKDRYGIGNQWPLLDAQQDYFLKGAEESNGQTILKFERKLETCDSRDYKITTGTVKVIYAYHTADPKDDDESAIQQHTKRGAKSLNLLGFVKNSPLPVGTEYFDVVNQNGSVPSESTTYWCQAFKIPEHIDTKHHVIEIAPLIKKGNEALVHHFVVYECVTNIAPHHMNQTGPCDNPAMPKTIRHCRGKSSMYAWAVGGKNFKLPEHVGIPIGTNDTVKYVVLETHYDNPNQATGVIDNSGLRFYYTKNLRQHDAATLVVGQMVSTAHLIPPMQSNWITKSYCPKELSQHLKSSLPDNSVNIFATFPHEHLTGTGIWTKHVRDGKELPEIVRDEFYDFNYQGDEVSTYCRFNTMNRKVAITGGESTNEEMCLNFLMYYPKVRGLGYCLSAVPSVSDVFSAKYAKLNPNNPNHNKFNKAWVWQGVNWTQRMVDELRGVLAKDSLSVLGFGKWKTLKSRPKILKSLKKVDVCKGVGSGIERISLSSFLSVSLVLSTLVLSQTIR